MHDRLSINSICFLGSSLEQQAGYWKQLGARRISLVGPQLEAEGVDAAKAALSSGNYQIETIIHPFSPALPLVADERGWQLPRVRLAQQIDVAQQLGARSIYMTTGGRGEMSWEQAADAFARAIEPCLAPARAAGITLMIENAPVQYADMHMAHSLRDTVHLAKLAGIGRVY